MNNNDILRKITQGMYVLTTKNGGCIVDAVSQVSSGESPLIAVAVMKNNYTNELMHQNNTYALSVLGIDVNPQIIKTFGFNSMRNFAKFENVKTTEIANIKIIDDSLGYMICEKIDTIENATHTLFIGNIITKDIYDDKEAMSYNYYQEHKDELLKIKTSNGKTAWICKICGYIYYGDNLPQNFLCPMCGAGPEMFEIKP